MGKVLDFMKYKGGMRMLQTPNKKDILDEYVSLSGDGIPVDPLLIAEKLGIRVLEADFVSEKISGLIEKKNGNVTIYIRGTDTPFRKRFTVAHELGHYALHMSSKNQGNFVDSNGIFARNFDYYDDEDTKKEKEANDFAARLLMPAEKVKEMWEECMYSPQLMSAKFQVSTQAMEYRLRNLGLI